MLPIGFETGDLPGEFRIKENQLGYYPKMTPEEAKEEEKKAELALLLFVMGLTVNWAFMGGSIGWKFLAFLLKQSATTIYQPSPNSSA
ncbi:MAG: hypothetical protein QNJ68_17625 [Microcoleaceae cyanobacterium MO_207.B10]|nr:hypothetical protein [Microcoleaceae cyanobacterium MO_207.B10]